VKVAVVVRVTLPTVPVIVTTNVPAVGEVHVKVAVAGDGGKDTLPGLIGLQFRPAGALKERTTVPVPVDVTVMVEVADDPAGTDAGEVAVNA
jgi:hypothetical protein